MTDPCNLLVRKYICDQAVNNVVHFSICKSFQTARLFLSHYGFLTLEGLKVGLCFVSLL